MAKQIDCKSAGINCPFFLRTESENELVEFAQQHVKNVHKGNMSRADVLKMAKTV